MNFNPVTNVFRKISRWYDKNIKAHFDDKWVLPVLRHSDYLNL